MKQIFMNGSVDTITCFFYSKNALFPLLKFHSTEYIFKPLYIKKFFSLVYKIFSNEFRY